MKKTFIIKYTAYDKDKCVIEAKTRKTEKENKMYAMTGLEDFLRKKFSNFDKLIVHSCEEDFFSNYGFENTVFKDIFK